MNFDEKIAATITTSCCCFRDDDDPRLAMPSIMKQSEIPLDDDEIIGEVQSWRPPFIFSNVKTEKAVCLELKDLMAEKADYDIVRSEVPLEHSEKTKDELTESFKDVIGQLKKS